MKHTKPLASLSFDLDNLWSYLKTHGDSGWESFPSYLEVVVPRVLAFFQERSLRVTVFIVGQDAALDHHRELLASVARHGHEIGNHSFRHEPWLHRYSAQEVDTEIAQAAEHLERVTGQRPVGFRGPGYSLSEATLQALVRRGYLYDASTLPSFLTPLARAYYLLTARLTPQERQQRRQLGGTFREGWRPVKPYRWHVGSDTLLEIPVTTMPWCKLPIHASYLLSLSVVSRSAARRYFKLALHLCRVTGTAPSLLLHPTDFLSTDDAPELAFFPAMSLPRADKLEFVSEMMALLAAHFHVLPLREYAHALAQQPHLPLRHPRFSPRA